MVNNISIADNFTMVKQGEIREPISTIVIPAYNSESTVRRAVLSALTQNTKYPYSVTVIDNGARVLLKDHLEDLLCDPRITLIQEENPGLPKTLNLGFSLSNSKYCIQLDGDDELLPNAVETFATIFEKNPKLSYLYGDCFWVGPLPKEEWGWEKFSGADREKLTNIWRKPEFDSNRLLAENYLGQPKSFPRDAFLKVRGFDASLPFAEDWDFILKMQEVGDIQHVPKLLLKYHYLPTGMTASYKLQVKSDCRKQILRNTMLRRNLSLKDISPELAEKLNPDYLWAS